MTLRRFLMFREMIAQEPDPTSRVAALLRQYPDWDPDETRTWESWKDADLPRSGPAIETVETDLL